MRLFLIATLLVSVIFGQGADEQCDTTDGDCQSGDPFTDVTTRDLDDSEYPVQEMAATLRADSEVSAEIEAAKLALDRFTLPPPPPDGPDPLCYKKSALLYVPAGIWYQHGWCYVHPYYRETKIAYAYCGNRPRCSNLPCSHIFYKYNCFPANYQTIKIWIYCPHLQPRFWRPFYRRLPQCCECRRSGFVWAYDTIAAASVADLPRIP